MPLFAAEEAEHAALDHVVAVAHVDAGHEDAQRVRERDQDDRVQQDLCDAFRTHLETLSAEEGVDEVDEDGERDGKADRVGALTLDALQHVQEPEDQEEARNGDSDCGEVEHETNLSRRSSTRPQRGRRRLKVV